MSTKSIIDYKKTLTKEEIKQIVKDNNIEFIKLEFCDINGIMKNLSIPAEQLDNALNNEIMLDGSSIKGFRSIETSDMYFYPDLKTFAIIPWRSDEDVKVARFICDIYNPDGTPFEGCPRCNLKKMIARAEKLGYTMNVGPEAEFFIFKKDENGLPTLKTHDNAGYYDAAPSDKGENLRRIMVKTLKEMGFEVEASHHEVARGQHEIDFKYAEALKTADNINTFKLVAKTIAQKHGLHATFMPKPIFGICGSGMHINQSLFKDGKNVFFDEKDKLGLSKIAYNYIAGIMKNSKSMAAISNPLVNSYKRLVPGYEAPVYIAWSARNRSPLIRIPAARGSSTRIELRNPDPTANPYFLLSACIASGLDGIKNNLKVCEPTDRNIYDMTKQERDAAGIENLPHNLINAVKAMQKSDLMKEALGEYSFNLYAQAKINEWDDYRTKVHQWEIDEYLVKY